MSKEKATLEKVTCPSCQFENQPDHEFCTKCGTSLIQEHLEDSAESNEPVPEPIPDAEISEQEKICAYCNEKRSDVKNEIYDEELGQVLLCLDCYKAFTGDDSDEEEKPEPKDIAHDKEFMDSIEEKPVKKLTPQQAQKREMQLKKQNAELMESNERLVKELEIKNKVADLLEQEGLKILIKDYQDAINKKVSDKEHKKDIDPTLKNYDSILVFEEILGKYKFVASSIKADIDNNNTKIMKNFEEIAQMDKIQLGIFEHQPEETQESEEKITEIRTPEQIEQEINEQYSEQEEEKHEERPEEQAEKIEEIAA